MKSKKKKSEIRMIYEIGLKFGIQSGLQSIKIMLHVRYIIINETTQIMILFPLINQQLLQNPTSFSLLLQLCLHFTQFTQLLR